MWDVTKIKYKYVHLAGMRSNITAPEHAEGCGNALARARRECYRCTCTSTSIIILDVIVQCATRLWRCKP
jgi:hypothetical protein